ncbi:MAG: hypothetical protein RDU76_11390 [Candidatus Edwardsbacteria bacterium]|nr:hypothetical protein [Candidatus Edwardsbacteria bacterium]
MEIVSIFLVPYLWAIFILGGAWIGRFKGQTGGGAVLSLCLGPLGWFIALNLPDHRVKCKLCKGVIEPGNILCRHCGSKLEWVVKGHDLTQIYNNK